VEASAKLLSPSRTDLAGARLAVVAALWRALPLDLGRTLFSSAALPDDLQSNSHRLPHTLHTHNTATPRFPRSLMPVFYPKYDMARLCVDARAVCGIWAHLCAVY